MCQSETGFLKFLCWLLPFLLPLGLSAITLALGGVSLISIGRLLRKRGPFVDGLHSPDLALEMIGRTGSIAPIVHAAGHMPLLRNIALDSGVFIPLYVTSFTIATVLLIGMPFACGPFAFQPVAALALLLTLIGAVLDWSENSYLAGALRLNAQGDAAAQAQCQNMLGQGRTRAVIKFIILGGVAGLLAIHAWPTAATAGLPELARYVLGAAFGISALGMIACPRSPRYLEPAVAIAGFGIALLFTVHAWKILP
nr:hypothetical protein [Dechloromonas sp.]